MTSLEEICADLKPTVAIGAAAIPGAFTEQFIELMGKFNEQPIIFALSNPTSKAECTAEQAYKLTQVRRFLSLRFLTVAKSFSFEESNSKLTIVFCDRQSPFCRIFRDVKQQSFDVDNSAFIN